MIKKAEYLKARLSDWISKKVVPPSEVCIKQTEINGYKLLVFANETVGRQISWGKSYESEETKFLMNYLRPEHICFDVGANVGYFSMLMASKATKGQVHAFEPIPFCFHLLCCSGYLNGFSNLVANNSAVADAEGATKFNIAADSAFSSIATSATNGQTIRVELVTLDKYVSSRKIGKINFLKLDAEGSELSVITGARGLLSDPGRRPELIMTEIEVDGAGVVSEGAQKILATFTELGYTPCELRGGALVPVKRTARLSGYNLFFSLS